MNRTIATFATALAAATLVVAASPVPASAAPVGAPTDAPAGTAAGNGISLGRGGFTVLPSPASSWVDQNSDDSRAPLIERRIANRPSAVWLTGPQSYGNLDYAVSQARADDGTLTLTLYYIPGRNDGLSGASGTSSAQYREFVDHVATALGRTRAVVVVEPDALWFVDRQTPPGTAEYRQRMSLLNDVVDTFTAKAPRSRVYLEAGTSSKSVTPERMAQLLKAAGVARAAGFAVNVSSFGPQREITAWAQGIRGGLADLGVRNARYVVDTGRNGNPSWDYSWCNPPDREVGVVPGVVNAANGLDANIWVKQPGTSDGSCGVGSGSYGGQFLPQVAVDMLR